MSAVAARRLPTGAPATAPIESSGLPRDAARLLVARRSTGALRHRRLADLPDVLEAGDVLVVNTSAVVPAAVPARRADGTRLRVHLSTRTQDGGWLVELRRPDGAVSSPYPWGRRGETLALPGGGHVRLRAAYSPGEHGVGTRLWRAEVALPAEVHAYLRAHGQPIRYGRLDAPWPLETYQTVFALRPGSAESPSAARGFTPQLVARLVAAGVDVVPVTLHTGVSSAEAGEPPPPEWYEVAPASAARISAARREGRRVVAVGTTVTRTLESVATADGTVTPGRGWTDLVVDAERSLAAVDGLLTGWHEPEASHLAMLEAVAGHDLVAASYAEAAAAGYRWHELGDTHLLLP